MSGIGKCNRTLSAEKLGLLGGQHEDDMPEYLRLAAREGNRHEAYIREDIKEFGWVSTTKDNPISCTDCKREGQHVEVVVNDDTGQPKRILVGHIDDLCHPVDEPSQLYLAEYKALGRFVFDRLDRQGIENHRTHASQITCYYEAIGGLPILYVHKSRDTGKMKVTIMEEPPFNFDDIMARLDILESHVEKNELAPCDMPEGVIDKWSCTHLCEKESNILPESLVSTDITQALNELKRGKALEDEGKSIQSDSRGLLFAYLDAHGQKSLVLDDVKIVFTKEGIRRKYDVPDDIKKQYMSEEVRKAYITVRYNK
tara:strand:+ start:11484 stop:12422 length:939 start_codon:yes stop_codon:yes gene_type:complete